MLSSSSLNPSLLPTLTPLRVSVFLLVLEPAGTVFLPDAGTEDAYKFGMVMIKCDGHRGDGYSVRLVRDVP